MKTELRFDRRTALENVENAISKGRLVRAGNGQVALASGAARPWFLQVKSALPLECSFLNAFLFQQAYAKQAIPFGCRNCFKLKVVPVNFRGLIALRDMLEQLPYHSKCGIDLFNEHSQNLYGGYLYFDGLAAARAAWREVRALMDAHPHLGVATPLTIKRGCTNYEAACGPSDQWTFPDGLEELEASLKPQFAWPARAPKNYRIERAAMMLRWLRVASAAGDDSYLEFTGGKPLPRAVVSYSPDEPQDTAPSAQ